MLSDKMYGRALKCLLISIILVNSAECANILGIFDMPSKSLHILGQALLVGLSKQGHNVTMISAFSETQTIPNYTNIQIDGLVKHKEENYDDLIQGNSKFGMLKMIWFQNEAVKISLESKQMRNLLQSDSKFDVIIQTYALNEAFLGLAHHFDAPVIGFVPFTGIPSVNQVAGNSAPYSYVPSQFSQFSDEMTLLQRTMNTIISSLFLILYNFYMFPCQAALLKEHFSGAPPLQQLQEDKVDMIFVNSHVSTESPRPYVPNMIRIGGYHIREAAPLSSELKSLLDGVKEGVVFFSFGSNVQSSKLPKETIDIFLKKFEKIPYKVIWKYESEDLQNIPKNVIIAKWWPQGSILAHPNVKAFITHGGMGSTTEALYYGVPLICIPFFGDQMKNCHEAASLNYGVQLPKAALTETDFARVFDEVLENPIYANSAKFRSELFKDQPINPIELASYWVNHVVKHKGAKHLKPKATAMPLYQYLLLDVLACIATVSMVALGIIYYIIKMLRKACKKGSSKKGSSKKVKRS